jgi:hypothetical protein
VQVKPIADDNSLPSNDGLNKWVESEIGASHFADERLAKRFGTLLGMLTRRVGDSLPAACEDWANTKAAYRFFSNDRVTEQEILAGHFVSTARRVLSSAEETFLVLHDTSEFSYNRGKTSNLGFISKLPNGKPRSHPDPHRRLRGILLHSSLVITTCGLPLGIAAVKLWTRKEFKGCNALKRKVNPTRIPIEEKESFRWLENIRQSTRLLARPEQCVHIGDRESDIFELFSVAKDLGTKFIVRTCAKRMTKDGGTSVAEVMTESLAQGVHQIRGRTKEGENYQAALEIKFEKLLIHPPVAKAKRYPAQELTVIHATETSVPEGRDRIFWKLLTNLPVKSLSEAIEKIEWYAMRWKIEMFHKILKSGCRAEESKLRTSEGLAKFIATLCIVGWRIFWMTMLQRENTDEEPAAVFTENELNILDKLVKPKVHETSQPRSLSNYIRKMAKLGGYLARASDPPPGNLVIWRGFSRLNDIHLGMLLAKGNVGN